MRGRRSGVLIFAAVLALCSIACGSASHSVTAPGGLKCAVSATAQATSFGAAGGNGTVRIATNRECRWSVSTSGSWIQLNGTKEGQGDAQVSFTVSANPEPAARSAAIVIDAERITIAQAAGACVYGVSPLSDRVASAGERRAISVTANSPQCAWTAQSNRDWLVVLEGASGSGNGRVQYEARPTAGPTRTGSLIVAGHGVTVTQGSGCSTSASPTAHSIGASGGAAAVSVAAGPGCEWASSSNEAWITIVSGATGAGPGTVAFTVGAWNGPTRTGTIRVGQEIVTVTQTAGCSFSVNPRDASVGAAETQGTVSVSTAAGCGWDASSQAPWMSIVSGAKGSGPGQVSFRVVANSGPSRNGTLTIAGQSFTVRQSSGCAFTINPGSQSFGPEASSGTITVQGEGGCEWTAASSDGWVRITSGSSGSGTGTVRFAVDENPGGARSASIAVAGHTFAVQQGAASCSYSLNPPSSAYGAQGGDRSVQLTTGPACQWNAAASESWIELTSPASGTGPANVGFRVAQNSGAPRTGTVTIAGIAHNITQSGACSYAIDPASQSFDNAGGTGGVTVTAGEGCEWRAQEPSEDWVSLTSADRGTGSGSVGFAVQQNSGPNRTATITIAGLLFTVQQTSGCTYTLSAPGQDFDPAGGTGSFSVDASDGCEWTASSSSADWLSITAGGSGTGDGTIEFSVAANPGTTRTGTITVGPRTFTVTQRGA